VSEPDALERLRDLAHPLRSEEIRHMVRATITACAEVLEEAAGRKKFGSLTCVALSHEAWLLRSVLEEKP